MVFKKGMIPWNKKEWIKKKCIVCKKQFKIPPYLNLRIECCSKDCRSKNPKRNKKIGDANRGEKNGMWKGDKAKYRAIHAWISNNYGKASKCENNVKHTGLFVWANISGKCLRDRKDYKELCQSCHIKEDYDKIIKAKSEYKKIFKIIKPYLEKETPIRTISRLTGIIRHKVKSVAQREGYKTDFRKRNKKVLINGYYYFRINGKYVGEHRLVVEKYIGRKLSRAERVHHINEKKEDNKIENLMIFKSHKAHSSFHVKIKQFGLTNPIKRQIKERWNEYGK